MRIWIDCTAAAHPLVLRPIARALTERHGCEVVWTARDYGQTLGLMRRLDLPFRSFGRHGGASVAGKGLALAGRSAHLAAWAARTRPDVALGHGSVDLALVSALLRIPSVQMQDYEHAGLQRRLAFRLARTVMAPEAIPVEAMRRAGARPERLLRYPGLKEDYYLAGFAPDPRALSDLGLTAFGVSAARAPEEPVLLVLRPPPETSAYHRDNPLYEAVLDRVEADGSAVCVVIPRTERQARAARERGAARILVPADAVDAQSLIAYADLVVSAGGTMNREAVALGTPVVTIFSGTMGAVDEALIADGRLRELRDPAGLVLERRRTAPGVGEPRDVEPLARAVLAAAR